MTSNRYTINEGTIQIPSTWQDQSMNVFMLPDDSGINLVINRAPISIGMSEEEYYEQIIHQFQHNLKNYRELAQEIIQLDKKLAHLLEYQWKTPEGLMYQCTIMQIRNNLLLTFTYSASHPFTQKQRQALLDIIYSYKATPNHLDT